VEQIGGAAATPLQELFFTEITPGATASARPCLRPKEIYKIKNQQKKLSSAFKLPPGRHIAQFEKSAGRSACTTATISRRTTIRTSMQHVPGQEMSRYVETAPWTSADRKDGY
jgi:hypothetical protein